MIVIVTVVIVTVVIVTVVIVTSNSDSRGGTVSVTNGGQNNKKNPRVIYSICLGKLGPARIFDRMSFESSKDITKGSQGLNPHPVGQPASDLSDREVKKSAARPI